MIKFRNTININTPITNTFNFLAEFENLPLWNYYILRVEKKTPLINGIDAIYYQKRKDDEQIFTITSFIPVELIEIKTIGDSGFRFKRTFILKSIENGTRLDDYFELNTGYPKPIEWLSKKKIIEAVYQNLQKLKELLENGETVLQDGRTSHYGTFHQKRP